MENGTPKDAILPELYFLIQKFLSKTPMVRTFQTFLEEASEHKLLPGRLDWEGNGHERTFDELERLHPHIKADHLLNLCMQIEKALFKPPGNILIKRTTLLGHGRSKNAGAYRSFRDYAVRNHGNPAYDNMLTTHNLTNVIRGLEISGPLHRKYIVNPSFYNRLQLQRQTLGHLSAIYCILFDYSGRYIISGADDLLVKLWSAVNGRLIATFRGAAAEISDIDVNVENTLLAAGSLDKILRVWDMQTGAPIAVLAGHTGMITSVNFCPSCHLDIRYLVSTSTDGSVAFWAYRYEGNRVIFDGKPLVYQEKIRPGVSAQMICSSFSPGGLFLATGSADHHVRVYFMEGDEGPYRLLEVSAHTDRVDSIQWAHQGLRFLSGSKDGIANIWYFETQQWRNMQLSMATRLPEDEQKHQDEKDLKKLKVTMVCWDCSDTWVITAVSDFTLKVWHAKTGKLEGILKGHLDEVYVLEPHPKDASLFLSAGHDGQIFVWDVLKKQHVFNFANKIEGQGNAAVFDVKWSRDGSRFAASDSHGHIHLFGFGKGSKHFEFLPKELFFHTDYRPLVRDPNHVVLDEQTQVPPHLMPPPFLVDVEGNPYPPMLQKFVPGRENCRVEQLIPNIVVGMEGNQEIIEGLSEEQIAERMVTINHEADGVLNFNGNEVPRHENNRFASRVIIRRGEGIEGVRQSSGNWQTEPDAKWKKSTLVYPMRKSEVETIKENVNRAAGYEMDEYRREMKRRPIMITTAPITNHLLKEQKRRRQRNNKKSVYLTRSAAVNEEEEEELEESSSSKESSGKDDSSVASVDSSDSSGCSDWVEERGERTQKRSRRRAVKNNRNKVTHLDSDSDEEEEDDDEEFKERKRKETPEPPVPKPKPPPNLKEIPEIYKPADWLAQTLSKKAPYCPQIGDEVVYFKQGHLLYIEAVKTKKVYEHNPSDLPWNKCELRDEEFVKIIDLKYETRPPRLCSLKVAVLDENSKLTGRIFHIKYHDMADVLDFLVLKQYYDVAVERCWNLHDKFRCIIDDCWWIGEIISKSPVSELYPNSLFMCYEVRWDNGEFERMSPWDLEPICEDRVPQNLSEAVPVLPEELESMLYQPSPEEWPFGTREDCCKYIVSGLERIMEFAMAEPFLTPVDLNIYPSYAYFVEYPIDLSTIKERFENHYYRRFTAAQFDIRFIAVNAAKFNEPSSIIVKNAKIITELCLRVIANGPDPIDITALYRQLTDNYESSEIDHDSECEEQPGPSNGRTQRPVNQRHLHLTDDWRQGIKLLLQLLWKSDDSYPFHKPVDLKKHPDYYRIIETPIDLSTIRENLLADSYKDPLQFCQDVRLLFQNSKNYNTNKKSKIYAMTERLQNLFEVYIDKIIQDWKANRKSPETPLQNIKMNLRKRKNNAQVDSNSSEESSIEVERPLKRLRENHNNVLQTANNSSIGSSSNSDISTVVNGNSSKVKTLPPVIGKMSRIKSENEEESSSSNSDEDSDYQPLSKLRTNTLKNNRNANVKYSDSSEGGNENSSSSSSSSSSNESSGSESENSKGERNGRGEKRGKKEKRNRRSDRSKVTLSTRTRSRRVQKMCDSSSESEKSDDFNSRDSNNSTSDDECLVSVSSRGRVRKLTPQVRMFLKK